MFADSSGQPVDVDGLNAEGAAELRWQEATARVSQQLQHAVLTEDNSKPGQWKDEVELWLCSDAAWHHDIAAINLLRHARRRRPRPMPPSPDHSAGSMLSSVVPPPAGGGIHAARSRADARQDALLATSAAEGIRQAYLKRQPDRQLEGWRMLVSVCLAGQPAIRWKTDVSFPDAPLRVAESGGASQRAGHRLSGPPGADKRH